MPARKTTENKTEVTTDPQATPQQPNYPPMNQEDPLKDSKVPEGSVEEGTAVNTEDVAAVDFSGVVEEKKITVPPQLPDPPLDHAAILAREAELRLEQQRMVNEGGYDPKHDSDAGWTVLNQNDPGHSRTEK